VELASVSFVHAAFGCVNARDILLLNADSLNCKIFIFVASKCARYGLRNMQNFWLTRYNGTECHLGEGQN